MSKLSERVKKAKKLVFVQIPGTGKTLGSCKGSKGDSYQMSLYQRKSEKVLVGDEYIETDVIIAECEVINVANGKLNPMDECQGNCHQTVCYHSMGWLIDELSRRDKTISFCEDIFSALNGLNFGGKLTKIISKQGSGYIWSVVRDKPAEIETSTETFVDRLLEAEWQQAIIDKQETSKILVNEATNLMRGSDDEGID